MEHLHKFKTLPCSSPAPDMSERRAPGFLHDSIIEEILLRLPLSSVFVSRCVCKHWLSLTTLPYFIERRELHHDPPVAFLIQNFYAKRDFFLCSGEPDVKLSDFSLDFHLGFCLNDNNAIIVVGSCHDLLLCSNRGWLQTEYFVVNPITRQWLALPPTLRQHDLVLTGFVCDPASVSRARKGGELRYRIVRIPVEEELKKEVSVEIFSSEDGQWNEYAMTSPEWLSGSNLYYNSVACSGILYWQLNSVEGRVMGLDPFNPMKNGIFRIPLPDILETVDLGDRSYALGMCRDKLKMTEMLYYDDMAFEGKVKIWELENMEAGWQLVKVLPFVEMLDANPSIVRPNNKLCFNFVFHPNKEDIIYLECGNKYICFNLKMMNLEIVSDHDVKEPFRGAVGVFPFEVPWWPTPIPALP